MENKGFIEEGEPLFKKFALLAGVDHEFNGGLDFIFRTVHAGAFCGHGVETIEAWLSSVSMPCAIRGAHWSLLPLMGAPAAPVM